jgi:putative proteasome-type protease
VLLTSGNLAVSQSVRNWLQEASSADGRTLWNAANMFEAAGVVGDAVRTVYARDAEHLKRFGIQFNCQFIFGGQIGDEPPRLFSVYSAGNFIEATPENPYFQIGEAKYGKPIIDRVLTPATPLDEAAKCALISMDSTLRSNISVGLPLDLLVYETDALKVTRFVQIDQHNQYFDMIHNTWGRRLKQVFSEIPDPVWGDDKHAPLTAAAEPTAEEPLQGNATSTETAHQPPRAPAPRELTSSVSTRQLQSVAHIASVDHGDDDSVEPSRQISG